MFGLPIGGAADRGVCLCGDLKAYRTTGQGLVVRPVHFNVVRDRDARRNRYAQDDVYRPFPGELDTQRPNMGTSERSTAAPAAPAARIATAPISSSVPASEVVAGGMTPIVGTANEDAAAEPVGIYHMAGIANEDAAASPSGSSLSAEDLCNAARAEIVEHVQVALKKRTMRTRLAELRLGDVDHDGEESVVA